MSFKKLLVSLGCRRRLFDGGGLIALLLAAGLMWNPWATPQAGRPAPQIKQGDFKAFEQYAAELIHGEMTRKNIVGLSAAVIIGDKIVWSKGFGYADREGRIPATPETVYRVGSISKIPNAIAVLKFAADEKIDLNAPITRYIPEFTVKSRFAASPVITPRQLMTHHAGLPNDIVKGMWGKNPAPFQTVVSLLKEEYLAYPPGTIHAYCNLGADLLGVMLERVSGKEYAELLPAAVLQPLDMANSSYTLQPHIKQKLSMGYNKDGQPEHDVAMRDIPAGNLYTNVLDLGNMLIMLLNNGAFRGRQILPEKLVREMLSPQNDDTPLDGNFKIGYELFLQSPSLSYAGNDFRHGGHLYLFHGQIIGIAEQKTAVAVLANSAGAAESVQPIAEQLLKAAVAASSGLLPPAPDPRPKTATLPPGLREPANYAGDYGTIIGLLKVRETRKGSYTAELAGTTLELLPDQKNWLKPRYRLWGLLPLSHPLLNDLRLAFRTVNGEDIVFIQYGDDVAAIGKRIVDYTLPAAWRNRQGVYRTNDPENQLLEIDRLTLKINKQGFLMLAVATETKQAQMGELVLYPVSDNEAVIYGLGRRMMETVAVKQETGGEKLTFAGVSFARRK